MALCSYANFRTSYRRLEGTSYTVYPGEWICSLSEITEWFRMRFQYRTIAMLDYLQQQQYITYSRHAGGRLVKFKIVDWGKFNTILDYNAPCQKDTGFFFFPIAKANELVRLGKCSELDIVLDLWMQTVYNEEMVRGSELGPVVYFRNYTGDPFVSYKTLAERWGISKSTVGRILNKLADQEYLTLIPCTGRRGTIIYLNNYLSTMFEVSDVMIDKEEVAMAFSINIRVPDEPAQDEKGIREEQIIVSADVACVPKPHIGAIIRKTANALAAAGIQCCECPNSIYKLYDYPGCEEKFVYELEVGCAAGETRYRFEVRITASEDSGGAK
jgi:DNA-binding Lrp family transcriptional regulator